MTDEETDDEEDVDEISAQVSVGGSGGTGNNGGTATIDNSGAIVTRGTVSHGLFAQSIGAGGGSGGDSLDGLGIKGEKVLELQFSQLLPKAPHILAMADPMDAGRSMGNGRLAAGPANAGQYPAKELDHRVS